MRRAIDTGYTQACESLQGYGQTITGYISETPEESPFAKPFAVMPDSISETQQTELRAEALQVIRDVINPAYREFAEFFERRLWSGMPLGCGAL